MIYLCTVGHVVFLKSEKEMVSGSKKHEIKLMWPNCVYANKCKNRLAQENSHSGTFNNVNVATDNLF